MIYENAEVRALPLKKALPKTKTAKHGEFYEKTYFRNFKTNVP